MSPQPSSESKKSFWSTLPGILTAVTALITAVAGLVAIFVQIGVINGDEDSSLNGGSPTLTSSSKSWTAQANEICARANDSMDALPDPQAIGPAMLDPESAVKLGDLSLGIGRRMLRDLGTLEAPEGGEADVEDFLRLGAEMNQATEELLARLRVGDPLAAQEKVSAVSEAAQRFDDAAIELGATTCAEGASFVE
jgi:hypothetical protein